MEIIENEIGLKLEENSEKEIISRKEERENEEKKRVLELFKNCKS